MKKTFMALTFMISYATMASSPAPLLDLEKINKCPENQTTSINKDLQGNYAINGAKSLRSLRFVVIGDSGIQKISNWEQIDANGDIFFLTEEQLNQYGYCVSQKIKESDKTLVISVNVTSSKNNFLVNIKESNKVIVTFKDSVGASYKENHSSFGRALIFPAGSGSFGSEQILEKISFEP